MLQENKKNLIYFLTGNYLIDINGNLWLGKAWKSKKINNKNIISVSISYHIISEKEKFLI